MPLRRFRITVPLLLACLLSATFLRAQYGNEWIVPGRTYHRFLLGSEGLCRIPFTTLQRAGLATVPLERFRLWRNGREVALRTSRPSGMPAPSDFLEFYGQSNDGRADKALYRDPSHQPSDRWSLFTDTAAYFLVADPSATGLRYAETPNPVAGNSAVTIPYCLHTIDISYRTRLNPGFGMNIGLTLNSSSFETGEGWSSREVTPAAPLQELLAGVRAVPGAPDASLSLTASGNASNARTLRLTLNGAEVLSGAMDQFSQRTFTSTIPASLLSGSSLAMQVQDVGAPAGDRMVVHRIRLTYGRDFDLAGADRLAFSLPASQQERYLEFSRFATSVQSSPVLFDLSSLRAWVADTVLPDRLRFVLPAGAAADFVLLARDGPSVTTITELRQRDFTDFSNASVQGDYLIISNPRIFKASAGDPVEAYRAYRASAQGGGYVARVIDIEELTDQFAYGIRQHPMAIRNFLRFARSRFQRPPSKVFLIGKGLTYDQFRFNESRPSTAAIALLPTFGNPGSDNMLASDTLGPFADVDIGRLSVVNPEEVRDYLDKVREQEDVLRTGGQTIGGRAWTKNVVHAVGGSDPYLQGLLFGYMSAVRNVISDTSFGANVKTFSNNPAYATGQLTTAQLQSLFSEGIGVLNYFGHSSASALEFNINDPYAYDNTGRYPFFFVNGCNAGNFFLYDTTRFSSSNQTLSEKYVLARRRGSIAFVASTHYGIVNYLRLYIDALYAALSGSHYGKSIGAIQRAALRGMVQVTGIEDYFARMHAEQVTLHGDPALRVYPHEGPDYAVDEQQLRIRPALVSVADAAFDVDVKVYNLGKAVRDSVTLLVSRRLPDGSREELLRKRLFIAHSDSVRLRVPVRPLTDRGENRIIVEVDPEGAVVELSETNNSAYRTVTVVDDEVKPLLPNDNAILGTDRPEFLASTADPLAPVRSYVAEVDTTVRFDSPILRTASLTAPGGLLRFSFAGFQPVNGTVYYWRVRPAQPQPMQAPAVVSSFTYLKGAASGYGQSHYHQFLTASYSDMSMDPDRRLRFGRKPSSIVIRSGIFPLYPKSRINIQVDDKYYVLWGCRPASLQFVIYDSISLLPVRNRLQPDGRGLYGSAAPCQYNDYLFEFPYDGWEGRKAAMDFLDSLPRNSYLSLTNVGSLVNRSFVGEWQADTIRLGPGKSLYHSLRRAGFADIDRFTTNLPFLFFFRKGDLSVPIVSIMGETRDAFIDKRIDVSMGLERGSLTTPWFGPAHRWDALQWATRSLESDPERVFVDVLGRDSTGREEWLARVIGTDTSLASVDAARYPYIRLRMTAVDSLRFTPAQPVYWRLMAEPLAEGALEPSLRLSAPDTVEQGQPYPFAVAFRNIGGRRLDSLRISLTLTDRDNLTRTVPLASTRPLAPGDTALVRVEIDTKALGGDNAIRLEVNPDGSPPEQFRFNNILHKRFHVRTDALKPVLEVTFDGQSILNRDIVSARPRIEVSLTDDSRYLPIDDTSLLRLSIRYPDGRVRALRYGGDSLRFTPAPPPPSPTNRALAEFRPVFDRDGEYELIVQGRDRNGNASGSSEYRVLFQVVTKPMISDLFNYPNPFSTSTAFVFTVTGAEPPRDLRIQILTVTGRIVREITAAEIGPVRIGRNLTQFRWDGTDTFGQKLANGVYLYRFVTGRDAGRFGKWQPEGTSTDAYFRNGYGKMQILR
jgi:hypothetical protein